MGEGQEISCLSWWLSHPCETEVSSVESRDKSKEDHKSIAVVSRAWEVVTEDWKRMPHGRHRHEKIRLRSCGARNARGSVVRLRGGGGMGVKASIKGTEGFLKRPDCKGCKGSDD